MIRRLMMTLTIAAAVAGAPQIYAKAKAPERPQTEEQLQMALEFVSKLLSDSSLSRKIEEANFPPAMVYLAEARKLVKQADESVKDGNLVVALAKRDEAIRLAFEAGHLSQLANGSVAQAQKDYESRLRSIEALRKAHDNIATQNGSMDIIKQLNEAIAAELQQAETFRKQGEYQNGRNELDKVYLKVRTAVDNIRGGQTLGELSTFEGSSSPLQNDYETKLRSINALLEAQQRIATEKATSEEREKMKRTVNALLNSAHDYAAGGDYPHALETVNQAYKYITASIEQLRGGETLVRALNFETPQEEYHYELDRNDTYKMLIHMLVEDKKTMQVTPRVQQFLDQANALRKLAERQAQGGDFDEAIKSLEQSTRNLIFAMRNAGFFVPG